MSQDVQSQTRLGAPTQLGIAFTTATLVFALPVYERLSGNPGFLRLLGLVLLLQLVPTAVLFVLSVLLFHSSTRGRRPRVYWTAIATLALVSMVRVIQFETPLLDVGVPSWREATALVVALLIAPVSLRFADLTVPRLLGAVAPGIAAATAVFLIWRALLTPTPSLAAAAPAPPLSRTDSVYILIFDELGRDVLLRDGRIDSERFPHFAALAADSLQFTDATTNHYYSCQAIYSLLSGRMDLGDPAADWPLLVTLGRSYRVRASSTYLERCNIDSRFGFDNLSGLVAAHPEIALTRHWLPTLARGLAFGGLLEDFWHSYRWAQFRDLLDAIGGPEARGSASLLHLLLPHWPYVYDANGAQHGSPHQTFRDDPDDDALVFDNYRQQTMLVDALLGRFIGRLHQQGLYDEATIVVTGDHGPRVIDHYPASPLSGINRQMPYVTLLIRSPRLPPGVSSIDYQHIDLLPTLLDLLQIRDDAPRDGVSALAPQRPERQKRFTWADRVYVYQAGTDLWEQVAGPSGP